MIGLWRTDNLLRLHAVDDGQGALQVLGIIGFVIPLPRCFCLLVVLRLATMSATCHHGKHGAYYNNVYPFFHSDIFIIECLLFASFVAAPHSDG